MCDYGLQYVRFRQPAAASGPGHHPRHHDKPVPPVRHRAVKPVACSPVTTARGLLTEAERVQAEQVSAATSPDTTRGVALAAADGRFTRRADPRAVYVVHAQEDVTASDVATDGEYAGDHRTPHQGPARSWSAPRPTAGCPR